MNRAAASLGASGSVKKPHTSDRLTVVFGPLLFTSFRVFLFFFSCDVFALFCENLHTSDPTGTSFWATFFDAFFIFFCNFLVLLFWGAPEIP